MKHFSELEWGSVPVVHWEYTDAGLVIFCRAAKVSRAHRVRLAKRERM